MKKLIAALFTIALCATVQAHEHDKKSLFSTIKLSDSLYMLSGKGGNLALSVGEDGLLLVDNDYADISDQTLEAIAAVDDSQVKFVINTHWHFDHTGANKELGESGSIIVAHENVRKRLRLGGEIKAFNTTIPPADKSALPVVTYADGINFHWNSESIKVTHPVASGHTDGDSVIFFEKHNVVHTGDLYFNKMYPFIDASSGGSMKGMIAGVTSIIAVLDDQTRIIPGHGALSNLEELMAYRDMLNSVSLNIEKLKAQGLDKDQVVAAKPTAEFDPVWGGGFLNADTWVAIIYDAI